MKLRTDGRSIRLRLRRSEVEKLAASGAVTETLRLPDGEFSFGVEARNVERAEAHLDGRDLRIVIPRHEAARWTASDEVGYYGVAGDLHIAIEKDFRCTTGASEDDADRYPNPRAK